MFYRQLINKTPQLQHLKKQLKELLLKKHQLKMLPPRKPPQRKHLLRKHLLKMLQHKKHQKKDRLMLSLRRALKLRKMRKFLHLALIQFGLL